MLGARPASITALPRHTLWRATPDPVWCSGPCDPRRWGRRSRYSGPAAG